MSNLQRKATSCQQFGVLILGFESSHMESMLPALPEAWFHHGNCGIKGELLEWVLTLLKQVHVNMAETCRSMYKRMGVSINVGTPKWMVYKDYL